MQLSRTSYIVAVCLSLLFIHRAGAAPKTHDVAPAGSVLTGEIRDRNGEAAPGVRLELVGDHGVAAAATTDETGRFSVQVSPGAYVIRSEGLVALVRVWSLGARPPHAKKSLLLVRDSFVARAQLPTRVEFYAVVLGVVGGVIAYRSNQDTDAS